MAVPPRWANLNIDLVTEIMNRVPCAIDRARMAAVCQAWLAAVARAEPLTFQLPSLLLPPPHVTGVYCYLSGWREHNMLPLPGPRYFGSYDGGWFYGRMLFVGRGCSRSYEVSQYPGFKDGIFFLDDRSFYDAEMMFGRVNERQYPCSDIGRWSPEGPLPSHVELYFPERVPSYNSPPAWLLP